MQNALSNKKERLLEQSQLFLFSFVLVIMTGKGKCTERLTAAESQYYPYLNFFCSVYVDES